MNAYTTRGQARIQPRDVSTILRANRYLAGAALAVFERQRGHQAEAEVARLLKHNGVTPKASASRLSPLRRAIGAALYGPPDRRPQATLEEEVLDGGRGRERDYLEQTAASRMLVP